MKNSNFPQSLQGIFPNDLSEDYLNSLKKMNEEESRLDRVYLGWFLFILLDLVIIAFMIYASNHNLFGESYGVAMASAMIAIPKKKKEKKQDDANLSKIKESKKEKKDIVRSSLYKGMDELSMGDQKKERSKIRRKLDSFVNQILGMDRSKDEKEKSIKDFNQFYKKNWKIQDYKIDNFSNRSDENQRKEYGSILSLAKKSLE